MHVPDDCSDTYKCLYGDLEALTLFIVFIRWYVCFKMNASSDGCRYMVEIRMDIAGKASCQGSYDLFVESCVIAIFVQGFF